jgi:uncharacterized membrane protein
MVYVNELLVIVLIAVVSEIVELLLLNFQTLPDVKFCGLVILNVPLIGC